ncbi:MAG: type II toxin-antitoxin system RelE/ParE family toxin [Synergistaceae bacterium]|nr:type II toxin-antitoxin system RelE/ParE family toxin [Synergistaceae bacterium]
MEYEVIISESAERDINKILMYMTVKLANPQAATDWADELAMRYNELSKHPKMYGYSLIEPLRRIGYRRFVVKNYIVFYRLDDVRRRVIIVRVFYSKQNYEKYL